MGKYFGTDGIRGRYGENLTDDLAFRTGIAIGRFFGDCVVGRDTRLSGEALEDALVRGLLSTGANVMLVGILPTPALSMLTKSTFSACGVMITASHNPPEYNGIKVFSRGGIKLTREQEDEIEFFIDKPCTLHGDLGSINRFYAAAEQYIDRLTCGKAVGYKQSDNMRKGCLLSDNIYIGRGEFDGIRVWLDCGFGAAGGIAAEVFKRLGAKVTSLNDNLNGEKINVQCGALYIDNLNDIMNKKDSCFFKTEAIDNQVDVTNQQNKYFKTQIDEKNNAGNFFLFQMEKTEKERNDIIKAKDTDIQNDDLNTLQNILEAEICYSRCGGEPAALGFAFDGDADRMAMICGKRVLGGDSVLYSLSRNRHLKDGTVVGTVMNNIALERQLMAEGKRLLRTDIGDKHILEAMLQGGYNLGGQQSGHYIFYPDSVSGDGILAAIKMTAAYLNGDAIRLPLVPQKTLSLACAATALSDKRLLDITKRAQDILARVLVRMSGTEPKIRIMLEDENEELLDEILEKFSGTITEINEELP